MKQLALVIITAILMASCSPTVQCKYVKDKRKSGIHNTFENQFLKRPKALKTNKKVKRAPMRLVAVPCYSF
jgi:PBP1b-binding outer membrane lipoprotein LpoB